MRTGQPARRFKDFRYATLGSWSRERRVVGKAEVTGGEANPRFVVTSLKRSEAGARHLYEKIYCARGEMENRIKECQLDLFADRTSTATMRANQLRLWFASMAYVLLCALRRIGLAHTQFAEATCGTIRLQLLKLGALVRVSVRRIKIAMASACPGRTSSRSLTRDCATPSPDTNQTAHRRHTAPPTPPKPRRRAEHCRNPALMSSRARLRRYSLCVRNVIWATRQYEKCGLASLVPPLAKTAPAMPAEPIMQPVSMISIRLSGTNIQIALGVRGLNAFPPKQSPDFVENFTLHIVDAMLCVRDPETHFKLDRTLAEGQAKHIGCWRG